MRQPQRRKRPRTKKKQSKGLNHWLMLWLGWGFVVLGILGMFLPILQGFLFLAIGLVILSRRSPRTRLALLRLGRRYPKLRKGMDDARAKLKEYRRRFLAWWRRKR